MGLSEEEGEDRALMEEGHIYRPQQSRWRDKEKQRRWEMQEPKPPADRTNEIHSTCARSMVLRGVSSEEPRKAGHASKWWRLCHYLDTRQEEGAWQVTTDTNNQRDQMWTITRYSFGRTQVSQDELLKQQHTPTLRSTEGQHPRRKVSNTHWLLEIHWSRNSLIIFNILSRHPTAQGSFN